MLFSLSIFPVGDGDELAEPVAEVIDELDRAGLDYRVNGMNTVVEGEWDEVMPAVRSAHERLRRAHDRVHVELTIDDHHSDGGRIEGAVEDVREALGRPVGA